MNKLVLGIVGEIASGKTVTTEYLKTKHQAVTFRFSDSMRDVLKRLYLEESRTNLQNLSTALRQTFGDDLFSKVMIADIRESKSPLIIIEGIRRPSDITFLKDLPGFKLIYLKADEQIRFERIKKRGENADDQNKTWEQFQIDSQQEPEQKIKQIGEAAQVVVDNNGSLEELYKQIEKVLTLSFPTLRV